MTWRIPLAEERFATLISAYAPTLDAEHNVKEDFYRALDAILQKTPATDMLILMGDFNAREGTEHLVWSKVIGEHGVGKMNHNGLRLLSLCAEHQLVLSLIFIWKMVPVMTSWCSAQRERSLSPLWFIFPTPCWPMTLLHTRCSVKSPISMSLSVAGVFCNMASRAL